MQTICKVDNYEKRKRTWDLGLYAKVCNRTQQDPYKKSTYRYGYKRNIINVYLN